MLKLSATASKKKVILKLKNNLGWDLFVQNLKLKLMREVLWGKKINPKNNHILITENIVPEKKIKWLFRMIK